MTGAPAALVETLPKGERLRLRLVCISLNLLEAHVRLMAPALAARIGLPDADAFGAWRDAAVLLHADTIDGQG